MSSPTPDIPPNLKSIYDAIWSDSENYNLTKLSEDSTSSYSVFDDSDVDPDFIGSDTSSNYETPPYKNRKTKLTKTEFLNSLDLSRQKNSSTSECNSKQLDDSVLESDQSSAAPVLILENNLNKEPKASTRKRLVNRELWQSTIRKKLREQGKQYQDPKGKLHPAKCVVGKCNCKYKCSTIFSDCDQTTLNATFWSLDATGKQHFYSKFVKQVPISRKRTIKDVSRRMHTFQYYFEKNFTTYQVCKNFFCKTLNISERRTYYYFKQIRKNPNCGVATPPLHGKHVKRKISNDKSNSVRTHIKSFPTMDSHYCRASTSKKYLARELNLTKMYHLYREQCESPVKQHVYSRIFNEEFNLSFFKPKKDICDKCAEFETTIDRISQQQKYDYEIHKKSVVIAREEKQNDKNTNDSTTAIISYDLQNVFSLPKANTSSFFYKRKFAVYNLTGFCNINKKTYCSVWHELVKGRGGNDIASALISILERVVRDIHEVNKIILWSDSCVPQNKNRLTSLALLHFMAKHQNIEQIIQKFSEPGHSNIQEVDAVHSVIDKHLKHIDIYSPISLMRQLKSCSYPNVTLDLYQMRDKDFFNYDAPSKHCTFPPYNSLRVLLYSKLDLTFIQYKTNHADEMYKTHGIYKTNRRQNISTSSNVSNYKLLPNVSRCGINPKLTKEKEKDIKSMLKYMPINDVAFYNAYLKD